MTWLKPKPQVVLVLKTCTMVSTVAILAQGASLAPCFTAGLLHLVDDKYAPVAKSAAVASTL